MRGLVYAHNAEIHKAAYNGDIKRVQELLRKGVNPDDLEEAKENGIRQRRLQGYDPRVSISES